MTGSLCRKRKLADSFIPCVSLQIKLFYLQVEFLFPSYVSFASYLVSLASFFFKLHG